MKTIGLILWLGTSATALAAPPTVGKWRRHVVTLENTDVVGNPFELLMEATFTHTESGESLTLPGYYAGGDTWRVGFMPNRTGDWTWVTHCPSDPDLDGLTGSVTCIESGHPGMIKPHGRKWKYTDGPWVVPIGMQFQVFLEAADTESFTAAADFLANDVRGHLFNFRLTNRAFSNWQARQFNLALWDRLEARMEILTERGLGVSMMLYTDDAGTPPWGGQSAVERLLIRYAVARLAGFPTVFFNSGIDIAEYRSAADINAYGNQVRALDPYGHPISSRGGGGSGTLIMSSRTFNSQGLSTAPMSSLINFFRNSPDMPSSIDDNWGEQWTRRGNFSVGDIRRAFWKCTVAGGQASHIRDNVVSDPGGGDDPDAWFRAATMADKLDSEQHLALINPFVESRLGDAFGDMVMAGWIVDGAGCYATANPPLTRILILQVGVHDQFDSGGTHCTIKLTDVPGEFRATWFNPRTGEETEAGGLLAGGGNHTRTTPTDNDWLLLVEPADDTPPSAVEGLTVTALSSSDVELTWTAATDPESGIASYVVYRDDTEIDAATETAWVDTGLTDGTTYVYQVAAINGVGDQGELSAPASVTTPADTIRPYLIDVTADDSPAVTIVFSELVAPASAEATGNYVIEPAVTVLEANATGDTVVLSTGPLTAEVEYLLTVNGVTDRATTPNPIPLNSRAVFTISSAEAEITGLSPGGYVIDTLTIGDPVYVDRDYIFSAVPMPYRGLPYVRTANDDKHSTAADHLAFEVNQAATIYVGYLAGAARPAWLADWTDTGDVLVTTDSNNPNRRLYARDFAAGTVTLGGNHGAESMYSVVLEPSGISGASTICTDVDADGWVAGDDDSPCAATPYVDCDDLVATTHPEATELCNGTDDDCDGQVDEGLATDADGDGHYPTGACLQPADDCDDTDPTIGPFATEDCDTPVDDDCDGQVNEGCGGPDDPHDPTSEPIDAEPGGVVGSSSCRQVGAAPWALLVVLLLQRRRH